MEDERCPHCGSKNIAQYASVEVLLSMVTGEVILDMSEIEPHSGTNSFRCLDCKEEFSVDGMAW